MTDMAAGEVGRGCGTAEDEMTVLTGSKGVAGVGRGLGRGSVPLSTLGSPA